ncbi:MAG: Arc family DNA-binding protein [Actinomycetota bacterium]|nr:Arc family DNA-binding protein [Actinomycetota bacterium]
MHRRMLLSPIRYAHWPGRGLDDDVRERLRIRAVPDGRSMEAEIRVILVAAVSKPAPAADLFTTLLDRFGDIGGVQLEWPSRDASPRAADLSTWPSTLAAREYPTNVWRRDHTGAPINGFDAQIASICRAHGATLATRNVKDFLSTGIDLMDPWPD